MRAQWVYPVGITNVRVSSDSTRLSISSVDAANVGTYTCTIGGITGTFSASLSLIGIIISVDYILMIDFGN